MPHGSVVRVNVQVFDDNFGRPEFIGNYSFAFTAERVKSEAITAYAGHASLQLRFASNNEQFWNATAEPVLPEPVNPAPKYFSRFQFLRYENPQDKKYNGKVCDTRFVGKSYKCDPRFDVTYRVEKYEDRSVHFQAISGPE